MNERVREIRTHLNMSQEEFGMRIGIKKSAVSKLENGSNQPSDQTAMLICREFGVNEDWLRTGNGEMFDIRTEDEELAAFCGDLCAGDDPRMAQVLIGYYHLDPEDKQALWAIVDRLFTRAD